jgi:DNA repair exonuclease SbcCD nuclease subunit
VKIAIISDTHFGHKNDSLFFLEESLKFFEEQFFPYLHQNNIKDVIHMGDLMDRRKYVNFNTLHQVKDRFIRFFSDNNINLHITLGNHDTFYKNTNFINSINELFGDSKNIILYDKPTELQFDTLKIGIVPWITNDNENDCLDFLQTTSASILVGHFEINGFEVVTNIRHSSGSDSEMFSKFDKVLSGHFHLRQSKQNIHYLGTQYELSFGDVNSKKGFSILDTDTRELEFIENTRKIFNIIKYDDVNGFEKPDANKIKNTHVKVIVLNKKKPKIFDMLMDALATCELQELTVVEDFENNDGEESEVDITQDTISIIASEIDMNENIIHKDRIKMIIKELYMESMTL